MRSGQFPNPCRPVPNKDDLSGLTDTPAPGFITKQRSKVLHRFESPHVAGGLVVTHRLVLFVSLGLGEDTPPFDLPRLGRAAALLSAATFPFLGHHGGARPIRFPRGARPAPGLDIRDGELELTG